MAGARNPAISPALTRAKLTDQLPLDREAPVVVVGAGTAGLSAALSLAEAGLSPLVLEADPEYCGGRFGGQPATEFSYAGRDWRFQGEHGIHGLWSQYHNLRALLEHHGVRPTLIPAQRQDWVYARGNSVRRAEIGRRLRTSFIPAPFHYLALLADPGFLAMLSPLDLLRIPWVGFTMLAMLAVDPMREGDKLEGATLNDFLLGWPVMLRAFIGSLSRSGLSTGTADVPLAGFVALFRFYSLLRRDASAYHYLRGDPGTHIMDPLVAALRKAGGEVFKGVTVTHLEPVGQDQWLIYWRSTHSDQEASAGTVHARHVVLASDASGARRILCASQHTAAQALDLHWPEGQATAMARLWFNGAPRSTSEGGMLGGDFILDNFFWLHRFQDAFMEWHRETGGSAVESHIYGPPDLLAQPDATVLTLAVRDTVRANPELRGSLVHASLQRNPPTHTLFSIGAAGRHMGIQTPWPGLYCCGDWVRHETPALFLERACVTGIEAANAVRTALGRPTLPLLPYTGPELSAVAMEQVVRLIRGLVAGGYRLLLKSR